MKFIAPRKALLDGLSVIQHAVSTDSRRPVLKACLFAATESGLTVQATDLEARLWYTIPLADVDGPGRAAVAPTLLAQALREFADEEVLLESDEAESLVRLRIGRNRFDAKALAADDFPAADAPETAAAIDCPAAAMLFALDRAGSAAGEFASEDNLRDYRTNGILFDVTTDGLSLAGTNGARIAVADVAGATLPAGVEAISALVPMKAARLLGRVLGQAAADEPVRLAVAADGVTAAVGPVTFQSRLMEGKFPPYRKVLATAVQGGAEVEMLAGPLAAALRQSAPFTAKTGQVELSFERGTITVRAAGFGSAEIPLAVPGCTLAAVAWVNRADVLDALRAAGTETVRLTVGTRQPTMVVTADGFSFVLPLLVEKQTAAA